VDNPNDSGDDCTAVVESDIQPDKGIDDPEHPEQWDVSVSPIVPGLIQPTPKSKLNAELVWVTVSAMETRRNN